MSPCINSFFRFVCLYHRCQFHQHFMRIFFVQKFCANLFCNYILGLNFLRRKNTGADALIRCCWNWLLSTIIFLPIQLKKMIYYRFPRYSWGLPPEKFGSANTKTANLWSFRGYSQFFLVFRPAISQSREYQVRE